MCDVDIGRWNVITTVRFENSSTFEELTVVIDGLA
jgi:hypothetical protein